MMEWYRKVLKTILNDIFKERTTANSDKDSTSDYALAVR